ncbi:hypothetical protein [Dyella subtropica]|uniref:hypothetical protein n=1 Tax=Dyella subtropica TaxID=2992127 RepID=UPI00224EBDB3|nr:hypothetical protein [Dyella subtropica]
MSTAHQPRTRMLGALALALAISGLAMAQYNQPPAAARDQDTTGTMPRQQGMENMRTNVQGMHTMPATVSATDPKTGIVDVTAGGMALKVHFPPAAMASLKAGDKIVLHLGFSKP